MQAAADPRLYRPELDGIRAICIVFTICNHLPGTPAFIDGSVGVDVFFALSGFLITRLLCSEFAATGTVSLKRFYIRRVFRIAPLYYLTIALYLAAAVAAYRIGRPGELRDLFDALPYVATFNSEYRPHPSGEVIGHAWTLGIEEKFYLLWPLALLGLAHRRIGLLLLPLAAFAVIIIAPTHREFLIRGYLGLSFGSGLALLGVSRWRAPLAGHLVASCGAAVIAAAYCGIVAFGHATLFNVVIAAGSAVLIAGLWERREQPLARLLALWPLPLFGRLTYAVYLLHILVIAVVLFALARPPPASPSWPLPWLALFATCYTLSLAVAWPVHACFERPLMALGKRLARSVSRTPSAPPATPPLR